MKFKYVGPHDAVDLEGVGTVERGHHVEVTGAVAESLSRQDTWQRVVPPRPPRKKAAKKAASPKPPAKPADKNEE